MEHEHIYIYMDIILLKQKLTSVFCEHKQVLGCNYSFPIDLAQDEILFGDKSMGKVYIYSKFGLIKQDS